MSARSEEWAVAFTPVDAEHSETWQGQVLFRDERPALVVIFIDQTELEDLTLDVRPLDWLVSRTTPSGGRHRLRS